MGISLEHFELIVWTKEMFPKGVDSVQFYTPCAFLFGKSILQKYQYIDDMVWKELILRIVSALSWLYWTFEMMH